MPVAATPTDEALVEVGLDRMVFIDGNHEGFVSDLPFRGADGGTTSGGLAAAACRADQTSEGFRVLSDRL